MKQIDKSLEELENDYWDKPGYTSYVVTTCFAARKKPLSELSNEEIRLLIGQKLGLKYLLPLAVDILKTDPLIEVTFYPGDLLNQLLMLNAEDWNDSKEERDSFLRILMDNRSKIAENTDIPEHSKNEILELLSGIKDRREKVTDSKHSDEFKRIKRAGDNGYEYAYTEYHKDSFDKIHDWERSEFEELIWTKYQKGIIKLAYLLPYLKKYDGMSRLKVDLASPSTPDGHKSIIADALDQAARYPA